MRRSFQSLILRFLPQLHGRRASERLYQLVRQHGPVSDHTFEIPFLDPGVKAYAFTFVSFALKYETARWATSEMEQGLGSGRMSLNFETGPLNDETDRQPVQLSPSVIRVQSFSN